MWIWLLVPLGYLLGSVSAAIVVCQFLKLPDPRGQGSKNPGATNVLRFGGKKAAAMTLFGDLLKGLLPVTIASVLDAPAIVTGAAGVAAFLGHLYPVFFGFQGGKGVATAAGVFLGLSFGLGVSVIATWLVMVKLTRISSLSAIIAALTGPIYALWWIESPPLITATMLISILCIWRHRLNVKRIIAGIEGRIGS